MRKTSLYRYFDADGALLYVGIAYDVAARHRAHRKNAPWFCDAVRREVCCFDTRSAALYAETDAIRLEKPKHNLRHKGRVAPPEPADDPALDAAISAYADEVIALRQCVRAGFFTPDRLVELKREAQQRLGLTPHMSPAEINEFDLAAFSDADKHFPQLRRI